MECTNFLKLNLLEIRNLGKIRTLWKNRQPCLESWPVPEQTEAEDTQAAPEEAEKESGHIPGPGQRERG